MLFITHLVPAVFFLALADRGNLGSADPSQEGHKKKLVIYTPIRYKVIHHHNLEKVPIYIKKHLHYHYNTEAAKVKSRPDNQHYDHYHYTFEDFGIPDDDHFYKSHDDHSFQHEEDVGGHGDEDYEQSQEYNEDFQSDHGDQGVHVEQGDFGDHEDRSHENGFLGFLGHHDSKFSNEFQPIEIHEFHHEFPKRAKYQSSHSSGSHIKFSGGDHYVHDQKGPKFSKYKGFQSLEKYFKRLNNKRHWKGNEFTFGRGNGYKIQEEAEEYSPLHDDDDYGSFHFS